MEEGADRVRAAGGPRALRALGRFYRAVVVRGRWFVLLLWVGIAVAVPNLLPNTPTGGGFGELLPPDSPAIVAQERSLEQFRVPVLSGTTVVVHQPGGLSLLTRADSILWALGTTQRVLETGVPPPINTIQAAIPVPTGRSDTTVTFLYPSQYTGMDETVRLARQYAAHFNNEPGVQTYVTGFVPAQIQQTYYLYSRLGLFELATVILIVVVVAIAFRSLLAPLAVLGIAAVGYLVYLPLLAGIAEPLGLQVPTQLEPLLLALLVGVITDYCVLFFSAFREELDRGYESRQAATRAVKSNAAVIAVAGITVAGGTLSLLIAPFGIFRGLGPGLALTVLIALGICLTLTPALMTILSWRLFTVLPVRGSERAPTQQSALLRAAQRRGNWGINLLTRKVPAVAAAILVTGLLGLAASPLAQARLDLSFTAGLPADDPVREGAAVLADAGLPGITAPTEVLLQQPDVVDRRADLAQLETSLTRQPGVADVIGPADVPTEEPQGILLSQGRDAARMIVIFDSDPLAADAIDNFRNLQRVLPTLVDQAGLGSAELSVAGQTYIASEVAQQTRESLEVVFVVALLVELLIIGLYLRSLIATLALLFCNALTVAAALGLTTALFHGVLGQEGLTFYAPFAAAILLIALGSDYSVFSVGAIWEQARRMTLRDALRDAVPRTSRAITTAGFILASTFGLVSIIPLSTFRQIAVAVAVGLLLDTVIVRPVLTPALFTILGRTAGWPGRLLYDRRRVRSGD